LLDGYSRKLLALKLFFAEDDGARTPRTQGTNGQASLSGIDSEPKEQVNMLTRCT